MRAIYYSLPRPLLSQLAQLHGVTVREFAALINVSKSNAQEILAHRKDPTLYLAFKIARYYEVTVDELFGWKYGDDGDRRPLVIELGDKRVLRLKAANPKHGALAMVAAVAEELRRQGGENLAGD